MNDINKKIRLKVIGAMFLIGFLIFSQGTIVLGEEIKVENPTMVIDFLPQGETALLPKAVAQKPTLPEAAFTSDFKWGSVTTMKGIFSSKSLYFDVAPYWDTKYAYVQIAYNVSQLIKERPSSLTFSINDKPFYSCQVNYTDEEEQTLYVAIPIDLFVEGSNHLTVSGYVRLYEEQGCIDDFSDASWIRFNENSFVSVGYSIKAEKDLISTYPYPFISSMDDTGVRAALLISDSAHEGEVASAMLLSSNLGKYTKDKNEISVGLWKDLKNIGAQNLIYVGLTQNTPVELKKHLEKVSASLKDQAVIMRVRDDAGHPMMMIVSDTPEVLMEGVRLLADAKRVMQETTDMTYVAKGTTEYIQNNRGLSNLVAGNYTLESIVGSGLNFFGPFHQESEIYLPVSGDYTVSEASKMTLKFRYSENLDFNRSLFTVYWGGTPITSKKLEKDKASGDELTFFMPADLIGSASKNLVFAFDLEIPDMICTPRQDQMPWAHLAKDSILYMPTGQESKLLFDNRPAPFQKEGSLNDVLLVVSDKPTKEELTLLGRIVSVYGMGADPYGNLKVSKASDFSTEDANYNIITVGMPQANSFITGLNEFLYFKYNEDKLSFMSNQDLVLSQNYGRSIGTMQLMPSPYAKERALLVLTGPNDKALQNISQVISQEKGRWGLKGDCIIVDLEQNTTVFMMQKQAVEQDKPTIVKTIFKDKQSLLFTLVATSAMLILFLSVVLMLIRMKLRSRKDK